MKAATGSLAARLATKRVEVVPATTLQAGLAAMVVFDPGRSAEENATEMRAFVSAYSAAK